MLKFEDLIELRPGGFADTMATIGALSPILGAAPLMPESMLYASIAAAAGGAAWWGKRIHDLQSNGFFDSEVNIHSDPVEPLPRGKDGLCLGYSVDTGEPLTVPYSQWTRHAFVVGKSGTGKSVFLLDNIFYQHLLRGGGAMFINGKADHKAMQQVVNMCAHAGRLDDLIIIDTANPDRSNTYNPILHGDPDEIASRMVSMIPESNDPGKEFYREEATKAITIFIQAIQAGGYAYNLMDLSVALMSDEAMEMIYRQTPDGSEEKALLGVFLSNYRNNKGQIRVEEIRRIFSGISGKMFLMGRGNFGKITSSYTPDLKLYDAILENKIVYFSLETMGKQEISRQFGKLIIGDIRSALGRLQQLQDHQLPSPPYLIQMDEAGSYMTDALGRASEQARSANVILMPAVQTFENLSAVSEELLAFVLDNTDINVFFQVGSTDTAEKVADLIGKEMRKVLSVSVSSNRADAETALSIDQPGGGRMGDGVGISEQMVLDHRVSSDALKSLGMGECVVLYKKHKVYHLRVPKVDFDKRVQFTPSRFPEQPGVKGLNLHTKEMQMQLTGDKTELETW
jgi:hypothetical protein